ncbi:tyrosine phosphatase family protein [Oryzicola mucosus]|uniref:Protein tyrosine phosphatase n=1 Tax=Oryzicola mucosus TaxID=2767425 RepID=A0A8J6PUN6_9HYPH|nr:tyrosine phosphatase family protein [Oryzicola mucosus]MBD0414856.1 protein tyrosine phosphatase [Oryzicola mucosus]
MIHVCPLSKVAETAESIGARRMITLLNAGTPVIRPAGIAEQDHLYLSMNDIFEAQDGLMLPGEEHVRTLLDFAHSWDRSAPLLIHCFAGVSRSTASAYIIASALAPHRDEEELATTLRRLSPSATPNPRLIAVADIILGREGRMVEAIKRIGRGADCFEGNAFALSI